MSRNADFQALVKNIAEVALKTGKADAAELGGQAYPGGGTVAENVTSAIATIGENLTLRRGAALTVSDGVVGRYVHGQVVDGEGKIAVIVALESTGDKEVLGKLAREIAMHVASANPQAMDAAGLDPAVVEREANLLREKNARQARQRPRPRSSSPASRPSPKKSACSIRSQTILSTMARRSPRR